MIRSRLALATALSASLLVACGGGGNSTPQANIAPPVVAAPPPPPPPPTTQGPAIPDFVSNQFPASDSLKNICETVRTDRDPNGNARPDEQGELLHELFWLRSWMNETYLYFDQVTDVNPNGFTDPEVYFDELLTTQTNTDGSRVDRFSFTQPTEVFEARSSGAPTFGYGASFARIRTNQLPRDWRISFTQDGSPAEVGGLTRGAQILTVDGADFLNGTSQSEIDAINGGLFPTAVGESHTFGIRRPDGTEEEITIESTSIAIEPVNKVEILNAGTRQVGYIHYHTFSPRTGEEQLLDAFTQLSAAGVDDLVLDFRYNGGGLLFLAAQIGYMTAGPTSRNRVFYSQEFNNRNPDFDPVNERAVQPIPFVDETVGFSVDAGQSLPSLDLPRVFILTTARSCSASEAVLNGLNGIGVEAIQIGTRTCGKSTGQIPVENCGVTFAPLHFRGVNAAGFGDFDGGFAPTQMTGDNGPVIAGCVVEDDFANALGDPNEGLLAAALTYAETGSCPAAAVTKVSSNKTEKLGVPYDDPLEDLPGVLAMDRAFGEIDLERPGSE